MQQLCTANAKKFPKGMTGEKLRETINMIRKRYNKYLNSRA